MRAGKLRHTVAIQERTASYDSFGQEANNWQTVKTVHAEIRGLSGSEAEKAHALHPTATHRVRMRKLSGQAVTPQHRLKFGARILNIDHVEDIGERGIELVLLCGEDKK